MPSDLPEPSGLPDLPGGAEPGLQDPPLLDQRTKAAIVVQFMLREGVPLSLTHLPDSVQADLVRAVGALGAIDAGTVASIAEEFADALESGGMSGGGLSGAIELMEGAVSDGTLQRLRSQAGLVAAADPWDRIIDLEPDALVPILEAESIEVSAVLLSKLAVGKAAQTLGLLPGERARRITYAVSQTSAARPDAVRRIGTALAGALDIIPETAFSDGPVERVGAILNSTRANTRNDVLAGLEETDAAFAEEVRRAIFTFANIPARVDERDIPKIVRQIEQPALVLALAAAQSEVPDAAEFILGAMSKRMADALRTEIAEAGTIDPNEGEDAMGVLVSAIRALEEAGEIHLIAEDG